MKKAVICKDVSKFFYQNGNGKNKSGGLFQRLAGGFRREKFWAVKNVTLDVNQGEILGILGANGSGKSTLIRMISTLLLPDHGSVRIFGHDPVSHEISVRRMINRVSVEASFFKKLSSWENLNYASWLYGFNPDNSRSDLEKIFGALELPLEKLEGSLENLSRGQQQKVAIARALFTRPRLLLLDEPTTGLDPRSRLQVQHFVKKMNRESGITVLLTTHDMAEAEKLCHRVVIMKKGAIIAQGTTEQLRCRALCGDGAKAANLEEVFLNLAREGAA